MRQGAALGVRLPIEIAGTEPAIAPAVTPLVLSIPPGVVAEMPPDLRAFLVRPWQAWEAEAAPRVQGLAA
jgi:hypothetical protein